MFATHATQTAQTAYSAASSAMATAFRNAAHAERHNAEEPTPSWPTRVAALAQTLHKAFARHTRHE